MRKYLVLAGIIGFALIATLLIGPGRSIVSQLIEVIFERSGKVNLFVQRPNALYSPSGSVTYGSRAYSPDGTMYAREAEPQDSGKVGIYRQGTDAQVRVAEVGLPGDKVRGLAWTPDSQSIAVMYHHSDGGTIAKVEARAAGKLSYFPVYREYHFMVFSPNANRIALSVDGSESGVEWADLVEGGSSQPAPVASPGKLAGRIQKGMSYTAYRFGDYRFSSSDKSLKNVANTGAQWISLLVTGYQDTIGSTEIRWDPPRTPSDDDLVHAIDDAHSVGLRVMLKPHVDLARDSSHWRGEIGSSFRGEADWKAWFASYSKALVHYAELASARGVEQLCVGTELSGPSAREQEWRELVRQVRQRFKGTLTYASNFGGEETRIAWWDAVDYIGVNGYYPLSDRPSPSVEDLKRAWVEKGYVGVLDRLAAKWNKPIIFTEIGYQSIEYSARTPNEWREQLRMPINQQEQANAYRAAIETFGSKSWLAGYYWWNWWSWDYDPERQGDQKTGYTPFGKLAEKTLGDYYHSKTN